MKHTILSILLIFTMLFSITGCSSDKGTPPVLSVDGMELTLGECTPSSFSSQDFEIGVPGGGVPLGEMPGNSWLSSFLTARKNGESYAYLYVYKTDSLILLNICFLILMLKISIMLYSKTL